MDWVPTLISIASLIASVTISYFVYREATKEPDVVLIIEEEREAQAKIVTQTTEVVIAGAIVDGAHEEAYIIVPFVFLNRGSKGGAVIDIQPKITNLPSSYQLQTHHDFKDGVGKRIDPRFFLPSIEGRENVSGSLKLCIRSRHTNMRQVFKEMKDLLRLRVNYKKVCSNGKLIPQTKEVKLLLQYNSVESSGSVSS